MNKRHFLQVGGAAVGAIALSRFLRPTTATEQAASTTDASSEGSFPVSKTEAEWREVLTPEEFSVLRQEATERPYTSPLNKVKAAGTYHCAGCGSPLYASETKFDSGTGWPSFYAALDDAVATREDRSLMMLRTEVHCATCGGHLGHVFEDGPEPTGDRHCINGVSLKFEAA